VSAVTEDGFLDGRLRICQPERGFRAGLDAVMLAAAVPAGAGDSALELGAGVGTASLCLAARTGCRVTGIEIEPALVALANGNAARNGMAGRVTFRAGDVLSGGGDWGRFEHVFCNPPFHDERGQRSPDAGRARALQDVGTLSQWVRSGLECVVSHGSFTIILRADRLDEVMAALPDQGAVILPLRPRAGGTAKRVIVQWRAGCTEPHRTMDGFVLHQDDNRYTAEADAILRDAGALKVI
jgi:tRNA1(Val) A37 N6-methylase TrmN6